MLLCVFWKAWAYPGLPHTQTERPYICRIARRLRSWYKNASPHQRAPEWQRWQPRDADYPGSLVSTFTLRANNLPSQNHPTIARSSIIEIIAHRNDWTRSGGCSSNDRRYSISTSAMDRDLGGCSISHAESRLTGTRSPMTIGTRFYMTTFKLRENVNIWVATTMGASIASWIKGFTILDLK